MSSISVIIIYYIYYQKRGRGKRKVSYRLHFCNTGKGIAKCFRDQRQIQHKTRGSPVSLTSFLVQSPHLLCGWNHWTTIHCHHSEGLSIVHKTCILYKTRNIENKKLSTHFRPYQDSTCLAEDMINKIVSLSIIYHVKIQRTNTSFLFSYNAWLGTIHLT